MPTLMPKWLLARTARSLRDAGRYLVTLHLVLRHSFVFFNVIPIGLVGTLAEEIVES